jgi:hypothetical protein
MASRVGEGSASDEPTARTSDPKGSEFVSKLGEGSASDEPTARTSDPKGE